MTEVFGKRDRREDDAARPVATFVLVAYNQESFVREAVLGAFSQTYEPLEIILSDDCSSDGTFEIMQELAAGYQGPHKVICRRSPVNQGIMEHLNSVHRVSSGEVLVLAAGDDISHPDRTSVHMDTYRDGDVMAVCSGCWVLGESGTRFDDGLQEFRDVSPIHHALGLGGVGLGATYSYRREVFDTPRYPDRAILAEDRILPIRAALMGRVRYVGDPLLQYRNLGNVGGRLEKRNRYPAALNKEHVEAVLDSIDWAWSTQRIGPIHARILKSGVNMTARYRRALVRSPDGRSGLLRVIWKLGLTPFRAVRRMDRLLGNGF